MNSNVVPNMSSNMLNVSHMTSGPQQTSATSSPFIGSQQMSTNMNPNLSMSSQMDSSGLLNASTNAMLMQTTLTAHPQQSQQTSVQSMQSAMNGKDLNTAYLCRVGHETVQEIVNKTSELFQSLRMMSPPNGSQQSIASQEEKKAKSKELLKLIELHFKRLRKFYERCNECCAAIDYIQIESLIPMKDEECGKVDDKKFASNKVKHLDKEHQELVDLLQLKNRQIKEIIDHLRSIVWEINTMLAMRKP